MTTMPGTREQRRAAESPETSPVELAQLAAIPELQLLIAGNPAASDDLLDWLMAHGSAEVRAVLDPDYSPASEEPEDAPPHMVDGPLELVDGPIWELEEDAPPLLPTVSAAPRVPPSRAGRSREVDDLYEQELEYRRRKRLTPEQRRAEDVARRAEDRRMATQRAVSHEDSDIAARASEIRRWEAAYSLAHDGAKPPAGYVPPIAFMPAGYLGQRTNGMAIAALVLAIAGVGPLGLIFGYIARAQIERTDEAGSGFALAAIILGWIGVVAGAMVLLVYVIAWAQVSASLQG